MLLNSAKWWKIKKSDIKGKTNANKTYYKVGKKVRKDIKDIGGTML